MHLVGRSEQSSLRLDDSHVSHEHASIRWDGLQWLVKDLGSLNHTFVDGSELKPSEARALAVGTRLAFGRRLDSWIVESTAEPVVMAVSLHDDRVVFASNGLLTLPSSDEPLATVYRGRDGAWAADISGNLQSVADRSEISVGNVRYRVCLPQVFAPTTPTYGLVGRRVSDLSVVFLLSSDLEEVEMVISYEGTEQRLPARGHNDLLLLLARARRQDAEAGLPDANCGWVYHDELSRQARRDPDRLNIDVHRIRRQFAELGLIDPAQIVERRARSRQLRIGIHRSSERPL
ncbi:MAG: FHA domain-containing protein [Pseudomonadota bacterium]